MMHKDLLLGIDVGTTGTKCSVYDFHGKRVASAYREYPMIHPRPGWTEQDPSRWWDAVCCNLQTIFQSQDIDKNRIQDHIKRSACQQNAHGGPGCALACHNIIHGDVKHIEYG